MTRLERLLKPRHVAVFGGSWAANVVDQCIRIGFPGEVWPVHPTRKTVHGIECFKAVDELPAAPDASFIGINRELAISITEQLSGRDAGGAVCFASGFAESEIEETGGKARQEALISAAGRMPLIGPNCYGFVNYLDRVAIWPDQHGGRHVDRGVAIITQSSNIAINLTMQARALPIAYMVTVGNQAQVTQPEIALELIEDERVTALGLHIEGFGDIPGYEALSRRARELRKPIVAMKLGRSWTAREVTESHTGSIAGSDAVSEALLGRLAFGRVGNVNTFLEALLLLHMGGPLTGRRIGSISCSGGEAALMADIASTLDLNFGQLSPFQKDALRQALGARVHLSNPLDYHTYLWGNETALHAVFVAMLAGNYDLLFMVMDFPRNDRCSDSAWEPAVAAIERATRDTGKRVALVSSMPECLPEHWASRLMEAGIVPLHAMETALSAAETAASIGDLLRAPPSPDLISAASRRKTTRTLPESEAKSLLQFHGIRIPRGKVVTTTEDAARAAREIGFPVVLKSLGLAHKTEANAVELNLCSEDKVVVAARRLDKGQGLLVEKQIEGIVAELLIGVVRHDGFGFLLTLGTGGTLAELHRDVQSLLLPACSRSVQAKLERLVIWRVIQGYRGKSQGDVKAIIRAIEAISELVVSERSRLVELEINPYFVMPDGGIAGDALVRLAEEVE